MQDRFRSLSRRIKSTPDTTTNGDTAKGEATIRGEDTSSATAGKGGNCGNLRRSAIAGFMTAKPAGIIVITPTSKGKRSLSPEPFPRKGKKKESSPEIEELDETTEESGSSSEGTGSEQETLPPKAKMGVNTRSSDRKRPPPEFKTPTSKLPQKSSGKGGSSMKKLRGK